MARHSHKPWRTSNIRYFLEYVPLRLFIAALKLLPVDMASNIIGAMGRTVGRRIAAERRIRNNLRLVWPDISQKEMRRISSGVWDNFARVLTDYTNLYRIDSEFDERVEIVGLEHVAAVRDSGRPAMLFSAHMGNWEMVALAAQHHGLPATMIYRTFNNPYFDAYAQRVKRTCGLEMVGKGRDGARRLTEVLRGGGNALMLVDVRMNDGIPVPFMGIDAMTPSAPAALAIRYGALLLPVHAERTGPARFRVVFEAPFAPVETGDRNADISATMHKVNDCIERWIRARPEQWLWLHLRWGKHAKPRD